jgi:hypothetical protein
MFSRYTKFALGALTGLISLVAMVRLVSGGFTAGLSWLAWTVILLAMVPFIAYAAWRARHDRLSGRALAAVAILDGAGAILVWIFTLGPVLALLCSLSAFVVIWVSALPLRQPRGEDQFVRIEDLRDDEES